jgi:glycosyltransferase involved in cell wall biosynthesis
VNFCTTAGLLELPFARVLADSIAEHHPGGSLTVLLSGRPRLQPDEPFATLTVQDLRVRELDKLIRLHDRSDLEHVLRPRLLQRLLHEDADATVYVDVRHDLLGPLDHVADLLTRASVVLSPRVADTLPEDGRRPSAADLRDQGRIDPGFVALRADADAERFLDWWAERAGQLVPLIEGARGSGKPDQGRRQLRRVLDLAPSVLDGIAELADPGVEVSGWNLHERPLERSGDGVSAGGRPLRSLSLDGYRPDRPHVLAEWATRVTPADDPLLDELLADYAGRLTARGWVDLSRRADIGRPLPGGLTFSERMQRLYVEALGDGEDFGDIFSPAGGSAFLKWIQDTDVPGGEHGITRYLYRVYRDFGDLPRAYKDLYGPDGRDFAGWCWAYGRAEIPRELLPPRPAHIDAEVEGPPPPVVEVAGYFTGTLGLGEAARLYVRALQAAGVSVHTTTVDPELPVEQHARQTEYGRLAFETLRQDRAPSVNLICVNAEELPRFAEQVGEAFFADRHNIGVWAWETDAVPRRWDKAFPYLDEIWVYSRYVAENLGRVSPIPVVAVPPPIAAPETGPEPDLGLPDGFRFMFMCDFFSTTKRKNPLGVVEAFRRAFSPGEGPHLVVKTIHADHRQTEFEQLVYAAEGRPDIALVDRSLSVPEKNGLLASCDCYVSLHRSEGYGLPLAECMAMGKPVIATAYSGNLDFTTPSNSYLVPYELTRVGADVEIYPAEGRWAEPDLDAAAAAMREVWSDQEEARRRGERARRDIAEQLSPERVGTIARERLERRASIAAQAPANAGPPTLAEIDARLAAGWTAGLDGQSGPRAGLRRAMLRLVRPFAVPERQLDRAMARALHELHAEMESQRRELERLRRDTGR